MLSQATTINRNNKFSLVKQLRTAAAMFEQMQKVLVFAADHRGITAGKGALAQGPFTIEAWICTHETGIQTIFTEGTALFYLEDGELKFRSSAKVEPIVSTRVKLLPHQWFHVAITRRSRRPGDTSLYINGVRNDNRVAVSPVKMIANTYLAAHPDFPEQRLQGKLLEVRVWRYARSQIEIQTYSTTWLCGRELGLVRCWSFTEGSGNVIADKTLNRINGVISGVPNWENSEIPNLTKINALSHFSHTTGLEDYGYWVKEITAWQQKNLQTNQPFQRGRIWA